MPTFSPTCTNQLAARPERHQTTERVVGASGDPDRSHEQDQKQRQRHGDANEPQFFADDREDEVRVLCGEEREALLSPHREALPKPPARADRDLRLDHVIARRSRIAGRIQEHQAGVAADTA